jgi:hypothetical protein
MTYTVKQTAKYGYKIYDTECNSIEEACEHAKKVMRLNADSGGVGSGYLASQLPRIEAEIDRIKETGSGTVYTQPEGRGAAWTIKKKSREWW